ncbi:hypothetical protein Ade02nite_79440 [Paractinoplanes deccanensis]|uniref:Uncharacterized protein n=1 Tax=Paractinoplanes deccanensis TaxID=113561 RepID=A0ABQ3YH35_9ACTN|nr:hypothetical protein [Actinoplanes deccanensis]GID79303.1 hypothetical protein Ade02nite_79440 [Actinoplanes deccanensis]
MRKTIKAVAAGAATAAAALVMTPGTALAATPIECTVQNSYCWVGYMPANSAHQIFFNTSNISVPYTVTVKDSNNQRIVYSATYSGQAWKTLTGVYSTYEAWIQCIRNCPGTKLRIWN